MLFDDAALDNFVQINRATTQSQDRQQTLPAIKKCCKEDKTFVPSLPPPIHAATTTIDKPIHDALV